MFKLFNWSGIPVSAHWSLLLALPIAYIYTQNILGAVVAFLLYCGLILCHEMGHATIALSKNCDVLSLKISLLHGQCTHEQPYHKEDDIAIAWGGVLAQLVLLVMAIIAYLVAEQWMRNSSHVIVFPLLLVLIQFNVVLIVMNLIPVAPLDGHLAWQYDFKSLLRPRNAPAKKPRIANRKSAKITDLKPDRLSKKTTDDIIKKLVDSDKK